MQASLQKMSRSRGGLYELNVDSLEPRLYNKDLAPTKIAERTWGTYDVAALYVIVRGPESIRKLENWAAPFLIVAGLALLFWAMTQAGGLVLYDYAWFVGFGVAALVHCLSMPAAAQLDLSVVPLRTEDAR